MHNSQAHSNASPEATGEILRFIELKKQIGLSRTTIWRLCRSGAFPKPIRIGPHSVGWLSTEVANWMRSRERVG